MQNLGIGAKKWKKKWRETLSYDFWRQCLSFCISLATFRIGFVRSAAFWQIIIWQYKQIKHPALSRLIVACSLSCFLICRRRDILCYHFYNRWHKIPVNMSYMNWKFRGSQVFNQIVICNSTYLAHFVRFGKFI